MSIIDLSYLNNGKRLTFQVEKRDGRLPEPVWSDLPSLQDMVVSDQVLTTYSQALTLGVAAGEEEVPLLGDSIYDTKTNANYPELIPGDQFQGGECVMAVVKEGQEVPLGHVYAKTMDSLALLGYAAAFQFSKKARLFNTVGDLAETWSRALGKAYNQLRNNLRFYPIISASLTGANATAISYKKADWTLGASGAGNYAYEPTVYATIAAAIKDAKVAGRPGSVILCNSADEDVIRDVVANGYTYGNTKRDPLSRSIKEVIAYDGATVVVGGETTTYTGCTAGTIFLIRPKLGFFERIKQDLLIDTGDEDKSRLIESEIIADAWLGVYAVPANNVQSITIPTS